MKKDESIKFQMEKVAKLLPYKMDIDVKPTDKEDEFELILTKYYQKPVKRVEIKVELK